MSQRDHISENSSIAASDDLYKYAHANDDDVARSLLVHLLLNNSTQLENGLSQTHLVDLAEFNDDSQLHGFPKHDKTYQIGLRIFLAISTVSATLVLAFEGFMYGAINVHREEFMTEARYFEMLIFLALFIFASVYQLVLTIVGLHTKNMLLLSMLCCFYACMLIYTGIQYHEVAENLNLARVRTWQTATKATNIATIAVLGITLFSQVFMIYFVLRKSVRWFQFKKIGANIATKRMYTAFQIHRSLLVFDLFFFLGFTVQFIVIMVNDKTSVEFILTCCMLPLTLVVLVASDYSATRELMWLNVLTLLGYICGLVYVIFKMVRLFTKYTSAYNLAVEPGSYFPGRTSLLTFGVITLLFLVCSIIMELLVMYNFGRGLLPYVNTYYSKLPLSGKGRDTEQDFSEKADAEDEDNDSMLID